MTAWPNLSEFRIEDLRDGIVHLVFDMPGRSMNVFSNSAIDDIGVFAKWLADSDARGCVVRSGKTTGFCAGADLPEIEAAYDMIGAAPPERRVKTAFDHFFRLSQGFRALETSGKPVVAVIAGLALGGGCELALACHHRIMTTARDALLGLPESLVGLLPGAGGTQRLPRLIALDAALKVLLDGDRLDAGRAIALGAADEAVEPGQEVAAAERWILSGPDPRQPWDRDVAPPDLKGIGRALAAERARRLAQTFGHYPALPAILDCVEQGLPAPIDVALRNEMQIFSQLIQRPEPRAMIRAQFIGRVEYDRRKGKDALPAVLPEILDKTLDGLKAAQTAARAAGATEQEIVDAQAFAGFALSPQQQQGELGNSPDGHGEGYWFERPFADKRARLAADLLFAVARAVAPYCGKVDAADHDLIDYVACRRAGFPAYVGGPLALARRLALG